MTHTHFIRNAVTYVFCVTVLIVGAVLQIGGVTL